MKFLRSIKVSSDRVNKSERISVVNYSWSTIKTFEEYLDFHDIIQLKTGYFAESPGPLLACFSVYVFVLSYWLVHEATYCILSHSCMLSFKEYLLS